MEKENLIQVFNRFAQNEAKGNSVLYEYWCSRIINDEELLHLIGRIPHEQPRPNLFFAASQAVALKENHALREVFLNPYHFDFAESFSLLKDLCIQYEGELLQLFQTKLVQTNEVNRAAYLYPIFHEISEIMGKPLILIEIGTSAGLLLNVDLYKYEVKQGEQTIQFGAMTSPVTIKAENLGDTLGAIGELKIVERIGIDLNILDLRVEEDWHWLQCLIWPEQRARKELLTKLREIQFNSDAQLIEGDFLEIIPAYVERRKNAAQIVIFHTHVANQFPEELKEGLMTMLDQLSQQTELFHVYNNMKDRKLHVDMIKNGVTTNLKTLTKTDGHGRYFYWS